MKKSTKSNSVGVAENVRKQIEAGGERIWRLADFEKMPFTAVAQALSRLSRQGIIQRIGKGLYYRSAKQHLGKVNPILVKSTH